MRILSSGVLALMFFAAGSGLIPESIAATILPPNPVLTLAFRKVSDGLTVDLVRNRLGHTYVVKNFSATPEPKVRQVILREFVHCRDRTYHPMNDSDSDYLNDIAACISNHIDSRKDGKIFLVSLV